MIEFLTSRSRRSRFFQCPRARYLLDEAFSHGWEGVRVAVPLVTGGSVHKGLRELMMQVLRKERLDIEAGVAAAIGDYEKICAGREFQLDELESQSWVFNEQRALTEALVRLAGLRVVPKLLESYEVLEVERMDREVLVEDEELRILWRSIPDALLLHKDTSELFILSWKTTSEFSVNRDQDARVDMQGLSEPWAVEKRLERWRGELERDGIPEWFREFIRNGGIPVIRGVQMVYLVKGQRRRMGKDAEGNEQGGGYKQASPLIYGYKSDPAPGLVEGLLATSSEWTCCEPHPMKKSSWYPDGMCPGDGRRHKRGADWKSFPVWVSPGVGIWMEALDRKIISPEAGDELERNYAITMPHWRTRESVRSWERQTRAGERRIAEDLIRIRNLEGGDSEAALEEELDRSFPQDTGTCNRVYGRRCPAWEICWGPDHVRRDPGASGIYQIKTQYQGVEDQDGA